MQKSCALCGFFLVPCVAGETRLDTCTQLSDQRFHKRSGVRLERRKVDRLERRKVDRLERRKVTYQIYIAHHSARVPYMRRGI